MMEKKYAKSHRDLIVYQKARTLAQEVFEMTKSFPKEETYSLTDQIRRSSRSVGAQIAEAWAKRPYEKHFISKLTDSDGEQHETQHWIEVAEDCGYISHEKSVQLVEKCREIGRLLGSMIEKSSLFCNPPVRSVKETQAEYFTD
ncbi:MAG: four helix bundle protein [Anaerolineales bacterium]|nr:four helix bundle protein [Anaerolineales bacterium]